MKNLLVILALGFGVSGAHAQKIKETEVPAAVKASQEKHFPGAKVQKWEKEGANYESEFTVKKVETSASYDANGALMETEIEIKTTELPKEVTDYVTKNIAGKKIKEASKIVDATGAIKYEAEVENVDYIFDSNGTLIKKEEDKEKDDDKK